MAGNKRIASNANSSYRNQRETKVARLHERTLRNDDDSDQEPPKEDPEDRLKWRGDPEETHSDWTIEIVSESSTSADSDGKTNTVVDTYHVHKFVLAVGARKSEYFAHLFRNGGQFAESQSNTSRIELHEKAAKAFPSLLDYVYKTEKEGKETSAWNAETAVALHFLGQYFGIRRLRWDAKQFWEEDLNMDNLVSYYKNAKIFHDEKILQALKNMVAEKIWVMDEDDDPHPFLEVSDHDFWLDVVKLLPDVARLSGPIAMYCDKHQKDLDAQTFHSLVAEKHMPLVSSAAAWKLMAVERILTENEEHIKDSSLRKRCVDTLSKHGWRKIARQPKATTMDLLKGYDPEFQVELLIDALKQAKKELQT